MNNAWIIDEGEAISYSVQRELADLGVDFPLRRRLTVDDLNENFPKDSEGCVFLVVEDVSQKHLEFLCELRAVVDIKTVVVSSNASAALVANLFRMGANDVLNYGETFRRDLANTLSRLRDESSRQSEMGRMITIVPAGERIDAAMLSTSLASVVAKSSGTCALIDMYLGGGDLATMLKLSPQHNLLDLLTQQDVIDDRMVEQAMLQHEQGIDLLASPPPFSGLTKLDSNVCSRVLQYCNNKYPFTIVHSDSPYQSEQMSPILASDLTILTSRLDMVSISRTQRTLQHLYQNGVAPTSVRVVAMRTGCQSQLPAKAVRRALDVQHFTEIPDDPTAITISINIGNPLVSEFPRSRASEQICELAKGLMDGTCSAGKPEPMCTKTPVLLLDRVREAFVSMKFRYAMHH